MAHRESAVRAPPPPQLSTEEKLQLLYGAYVDLVASHEHLQRQVAALISRVATIEAANGIATAPAAFAAAVAAAATAHDEVEHDLSDVESE